MVSSKIVVIAVTMLINSSRRVQCGVPVAAPVIPAAPAIRYTQVAPQNVHPFAAQVSTFTRGLNILAAPYAAGVLPAPGPAIFSRAALPGPIPAPLAPAPVAPAYAAAPAFAAAAHAFAPAVPHLGPVAPAFAAPVPAPLGPAALPAPFLPAAPSPLLPAPFARSVHAVAPAYAPYATHLAAAPPAIAPALHSTTLLG